MLVAVRNPRVRGTGQFWRCMQDASPNCRAILIRARQQARPRATIITVRALGTEGSPRLAGWRLRTFAKQWAPPSSILRS